MSIADKLQDLINAKADMKTALQEKNCDPAGGLTTYADAISQIADNYGLQWGFKNGTTNRKPPGYYRQYNSYMKVAQQKIDSDGKIEAESHMGTSEHCWYGLTNWKLTRYPYSLYEAGYINLRYIPALECSTLPSLKSTFASLPSLRYCCDLYCPEITSMYGAFANCVQLGSAPHITTSKVTTMVYAFEYCSSLLSVPLYDASNVLYTTGMFYECTALRDLDGFSNLGKQSKFTTGYSAGKIHNMFYGCINLSRQSVINVFNNLYDRAAAGYEMTEMAFEHEVIERLTDEDIAIATNKGWIIIDGIS